MKELLVCTPYFNHIGGTELEAVNTAIFLYDTKEYKRVSIFTPKEFNDKLFNEMIDGRDIKIFNYPQTLSSPLMLYLDSFFYKLKFDCSFSEFMYWKYKSLFFCSAYILAYPRSVYFFSILKAFSKQKKITAKITMWHFKTLKRKHQLVYKKFQSIIVFNKEQSDFWKKEYHLHNLCISDIIIPNENNLLNINIVKFDDNNSLRFGYLGRIAKEKNIESMIKLIAYLNHTKGYNSSLYIQGTGSKDYIISLKLLIKKLDVQSFITFKDQVISPLKTECFYNKIDVFLVTSLHEGGPMTALEAAAAGRMILGYNIGAMYDRFNSLPFVVNNTYEDLCKSAVDFMKLDSQEKNKIVSKIREFYKIKLSNFCKGKELLKILGNDEKC